jgi:uncharacterized protein (DUF1330 family)
MNKKTLFISGVAVTLVLGGLCTFVRAEMPAPKAYIIAEITVTDPEAYKAYVAAVSPVVARFGGQYRVRGGQTVQLEGEPPKGRVVVIEFENMAAARKFDESAEYAAVAGLRHKAATSRLYIVEGIG